MSEGVVMGRPRRTGGEGATEAHDSPDAPANAVSGAGAHRARPRPVGGAGTVATAAPDDGTNLAETPPEPVGSVGSFGPVGPETPFRQIGDVPTTAWGREAERVGSPIAPAELDACARAAAGFGALALAQAVRESGLGRHAPAGSRNALGLMGPDGRAPLRFDRWADGFAEHRRRLVDLAYKGGAYAPADLTLADFVATYVGGPGCRASGLARCANGESRASVGQYLAGVVEAVNRLRGTAGPVPEDARPNRAVTAGIGPGATPPIAAPRSLVSRIIPPALNTAWDDLGERRLKGVCLHRMLGTLDGTDAWFRGAARATSRTDFGIGDGTIYQWTPLEGRMAPWASGPANDLEGNGAAFVSRYGIAAVNRDLVSIEIAGQYESGVPPADWACLVDLVAWLAATRLGLDAATWPRNRDGLPAIYGHWEFGPKPCPGSVVRGRVGELAVAVRQRLMAGG